MRRLNRKQKILGFLAIAAFGSLLAPFVAVQVQERIFRHRAERLLADIRSLQMRKANLTELQAVFNRWSPDGDPCSERDCALQAYLWYSCFNVNSNEAAINWRELWLRLFRMFGGHLASVHAHAQVHDGVVSVISFQVDMEISSHRDVRDYYQGDMLSGVAAYVPRFSIQRDWRGLTLHPNYVIDEGYPKRWHPRTPDVYALFGPHADPADVARLTSFDLSCLTRWAPCRKPGDLMPEAAAQYAKEEPQLARARMDHVCGPDIVGLMARDAQYAGVVEVTGNRTEHLGDWGEVPIPTVRLIQDFEPASDWKTGESRNLEILDANTDRIVTSLPPEVHPGNHFIILAQTGYIHRAVRAERCGIVPLNPANLDIVRHAIAENLLPAKP